MTNTTVSPETPALGTRAPKVSAPRYGVSPSAKTAVATPVSLLLVTPRKKPTALPRLSDALNLTSAPGDGFPIIRINLAVISVSDVNDASTTNPPASTATDSAIAAEKRTVRVTTTGSTVIVTVVESGRTQLTSRAFATPSASALTVMVEPGPFECTRRSRKGDVTL